MEINCDDQAECMDGDRSQPFSGEGNIAGNRQRLKVDRDGIMLETATDIKL